MREPDRIARDLHDEVIQRLFALGLDLQAVHRSGAATEKDEALDRALDHLDATIREIRSAIRALG